MSNRILLFLAIALLASCGDSALAEESRPNVLILMFDDMRFDSFSYRGGPVSTPNIDSLAAESVRFDTAMTTTGLCSPSRAAMFTGRWGHRTGLDDNLELYHTRLFQLDPSEGGLLRRAADAGYKVGYVGKWHLGPQGPAMRGAEFIRGTAHTRVRKDRHYIPYEERDAVRRYNKGERDANGEKQWYFLTLEGSYEDTDAAEKARQGQEMLRWAAEGERPFFGVVSFNQPHPPYRVPEPYASMYDPDEVELPVNHEAKRVNKPMAQDEVLWPWHDTAHMTEEDWRRSRAHYYGAIALVDRVIADLVETAKEVGLYDDLRIVFVGDQGSMIGEHGLFDKAPYAYDELMRIPLLIRDPGAEPRVVNRLVSLMDIAPTLGEIMSLENDGAVDGRSLVSLMNEGDVAMADKDDHALYAFEWYNGSWFGVRAVRTPDFKYVWYPADNRDEFYDLRNDPGEIRNIFANDNYADERKSLVRILESELLRTEDPAIEPFRHHMRNILQD